MAKTFRSHIQRQDAKNNKKGVLHDLDFLDFDTCIDCIEGKLPIRARKDKKNRKQDVLELIHTNISKPITPSEMGDHKYFITFINYYSIFG